MGFLPLPDRLIIGNFVSFPANTPNEIQGAVSDSIYRRRFVRVWYGNPATGEVSRPPKSVVEGFIKRASDFNGLPMIVSKGSVTGPLLNVFDVLRIASIIRKKTPDELIAAGITASTVMTAEPVYSHPSFNPGTWALKNDTPGVYVALWNWLPTKVFTSEAAALRYISLMRGDVVTVKSD